MAKTAVITGATQGIGWETARQFAAAGYGVAIHYHKKKEQAQALCRALTAQGADASIFCADLSDSLQAGKLIGAAERRFGRIDVLVNNAGIAQQKLFTDLTDEDWLAMLHTNLSSVFYCCRAALPGMIRRKQGKIINISSIWGITGASCEVHYSAAKAGVIGLTKALAKEVGPSGIQVNCIAPGVIDTPMNSRLTPETLASLREETPLERIGTPADIAQSALFLAGAGGDFITGQVLSPNGGFVI